MSIVKRISIDLQACKASVMNHSKSGLVCTLILIYVLPFQIFESKYVHYEICHLFANLFQMALCNYIIIQVKTEIMLLITIEKVMVNSTCYFTGKPKALS